MNPVLDTSLLQQGKQLDKNSAELDSFLKKLSRSADDNAIDRVITLYKKEIVKLERDIWQQAPSQQDIDEYQNAFAVLEKLYQLKSTDTRYDFKIVIPVADRPKHLKHCLDSLFTLCESYNYGGRKKNRYHKISVLIADDSREPENIEQHKIYCDSLNDRGIATEYFGLAEQYDLVSNTTSEHDGLANIISGTDDIDDLFFNGNDLAFIPGLYYDLPWVRGVDIGSLLNRCHCPVIIYHYAFQHCRACFTGPDLLEFLVEVR